MAIKPTTLLELLRSESKVDCDTLDVQVAQTLGPFVDCTSNQAIAYGEAQKSHHYGLIKDAICTAQALSTEYQGISLEELATEIIMIKLSLLMVPYLTGFVHTQTNPHYSYSLSKTVTNAERIIDLYHKVDPDFDVSRVCIKIPSTWEGLQACRALESKGIATLATTLFSMEQAAVAADAQCTYIAPYVNELMVHFVSGYVDNDKGFELCRSAQRYYSKLPNCKTQVLPASLTTIGEVMKLVGVNHITVSPLLLAELAATPSEIHLFDVDTQLFLRGKEDETAVLDYSTIIHDENSFRYAYASSKNGANEAKLTQAIKIFSEMQDSLESLVRKTMAHA